MKLIHTIFNSRLFIHQQMFSHAIEILIDALPKLSIHHKGRMSSLFDVRKSESRGNVDVFLMNINAAGKLPRSSQ